MVYPVSGRRSKGSISHGQIAGTIFGHIYYVSCLLISGSWLRLLKVKRENSDLALNCFGQAGPVLDRLLQVCERSYDLFCLVFRKLTPTLRRQINL